MNNDCAAGVSANGGSSYENYAAKTTVGPYISGASTSFTTGEIEVYNFI